MKLYVASSWRNMYQPEVVMGLREVGHEVYDFRHPSHETIGFYRSAIDLVWKQWTPQQFVENLNHPIANRGFAADTAGMEWAEGCVLVTPCGISAHLEAGWFAGKGLPVWVLLSSGEPELMYKLCTGGLFGGLGPLMLAIQKWEDQQDENTFTATSVGING